MRRKIVNNRLKKSILEILGEAKYGMSINSITDIINNKYKIKVSPQVVKRHLDELKEEGRIEEE